MLPTFLSALLGALRALRALLFVLLCSQGCASALCLVVQFCDARFFHYKLMVE